MSRKTITSPLNSLAMRPVDTMRPARYHAGHLDTDWQRDLILPFQAPAYYHQKVERGDRFRFEVKCIDNIAHALTVINCQGVTVLTITESGSEALPGDLTPAGDQLTTYLYKLSDLSALTVDGVYYFLFSVTYDVSHSYQEISEPITLADTHPDTMLLEYSHSENKDDMLFEQMPGLRRIRVEGYIADFQPQSSDTVYEDQDYNLDLLDSTAYRGWTFFVGRSDNGIPDWLLDKLNRIISLNYVLFNGKQYTKASAGAKWNKEASLTYPLYAANIEIREADNNEGFEHTDTALNIYTVPGYPYAISSLVIGRTSPNVIIGNTDIIHNSTEEAAYIAAVNAALPDLELYGTVVKTGSVVQYINAVGEHNEVAQAVIYTTYFGYTQTMASGLATGLRVRGFIMRLGNLITDWGDGAITRTGATSMPVTVNHTYAVGGGTFTVQMWGPVQGFTSFGAGKTAFGGTLPPLTDLRLPGVGFAGNTFDFALLTPAAATLRTLIITGAGLTSITAPVYGLPYLSLVDFSGNALIGVAVGNLIYLVYNNANPNNIIGGTLSAISQTPPATLNATGSFYESRLTSSPLFWTVNN